MILAQRRHWVVAGSAALMATGLAGCGIQPTGISVVGAAPSALSPSATPSAQEIASSGQVYIYLLQDQDGTNEIVPVLRTIVGQKIDDATVAQLLVKGPTDDEAKQGYTSEVPDSLVVAPNALGFGDAYTLSTYLDSWGRAQFVCTMQEYDKSSSVGYYYPGTVMTAVNWVACKDTTSQPYIMLPGLITTDGVTLGKPTEPSPTNEPLGK